MTAYGLHILKKAPFIKLVAALAAGILVQWRVQVNASTWWILLLTGLVLLLSFYWLSFFKKYRLSIITGIATTICFFCFGALITFYKDVRNHDDWLGKWYKPKDALVVTLSEPLNEKTKSWKADAKTEFLVHDGQSLAVKGDIIVYFRKDTSGNGDSSLKELGYGSRIIFKKSLQEIKNSGNPDGFDYKRYALFQGITHQVFLKQGEYEILEGKNKSAVKQFIFSTREKVLSVLRNNIRSEKELGLAEALLIGYKNDLDQALVQSYTNTGVVHIIAISGLHLGLIYWLLSLLAKPLRKRKKTKWISPVFIITGLWLFTLLAGAQPSVLRSAVMFTCIVLGQSLGRKNNSIYNTLAVSAFILLCINPFWLWDVGFQLSYAAVLSIVIFMRPVYNWLYFKNKALDFIWKLNAVTIAAQILTVPLGIYHFHQFPNYFLLTNFVAVPLSSLIVLGEILLCAVAWIPAVAVLIGHALKWLIWCMNSWIERIEAIRFSLWDGLHISLLQTILLLIAIGALSYWLLERSAKGLKMGLVALLGFAVIRSLSFISANNQQKIIVYNVPQRRAIDLIDGRHYYFAGDQDLLADDFLRNFHLKPSRIYYRISPAEKLNSLTTNENYLSFTGKHILLIDSTTRFEPTDNKMPVDLLVISKNPRLYISKLIPGMDIKQVVFDGSCPAWKVNYWKKDCDSLHIPWHDVTEKGAFVMNF